jgi:hypothetical protein
MERLPVVRKRVDARQIVSTVIAALLIVVGVVIYEMSFTTGIHPVVFWSGVTLTVAGGIWLASDWFGL